MTQRSLLRRHESGVSIIEMLTTIIVTAWIAAAITEICVAQNVVAFRTYNKIEALTSARRLISFIEQDVHNSRFFGDQYGLNFNQFPGGGSSDPYGAGGPTDINISGFTTFPNTTGNTTWPAVPYALGAQTLIIQVPILTSDVAMVPTKSTTGAFWNVDTIVYQVLADTTQPNTGQFIVQRDVFPGEHLAGYQPLPTSLQTSKPQTIVTGVIGPVDPAAPADPIAGTPPPKVFQYLCKQYPLYSNKPGALIANPPQSSDALNINGVAINMEVFSDRNSQRSDLQPKTAAFRSEIYARGNLYSP